MVEGGRKWFKHFRKNNAKIKSAYMDILEDIKFFKIQSGESVLYRYLTVKR